MGAHACHQPLLTAKDAKNIRARLVYNFLLQGSGWPTPFICKLTTVNRQGDEVQTPVAFLLPHELLDVLAAHGDIKALCDCGFLDVDSQQRLGAIKKKLNSKNVVPIAIWGDGVPVSWDRKESVEIYSWGLCGQEKAEHQRLRFPICCVPHHLCNRQTHLDIMYVIKWSLKCMAAARWPDSGPWEVELEGKHRKKMAGRDLPVHGVCLHLKSDWKFQNEVLGLPRWLQKDGCCLRCNILPDDIEQAGEDAPWRQPENRLSHIQVLNNLIAQDAKLATCWSWPFFTVESIRLDWLHCADQGVTAYFLGGVMSWYCSMPRFGRSKEKRCKALWKSILCWYKANKVDDKLKALKVNRFQSKSAPAFLKAGGAVVRKLLPFFVEMAKGWHPNECTPEMFLVKEALDALMGCYQCLSKDGPQNLRVCSIGFALALSKLKALRPSRYAYPPKVHMFLELCSEPGKPSAHWNYRDEDFGGTIARMSHRQGGHDTPLATSLKAVRSFCLKHPPPRLVA